MTTYVVVDKFFLVKQIRVGRIQTNNFKRGIACQLLHNFHFFHSM